MKHLTVINIDDWSMLFAGEPIFSQGHSTRIYDLIDAAKGEPVTLEQINADGTKLEKYLKKHGDLPSNATLSGVRKMLSK